MVVVATFYRFVALPDVPHLRRPLLDLCERLGIRGTILLAPEGINGTVAGAADAVAALLGALEAGPLFSGRLEGIDVRRSNAAAMPFGRMKVRLKREIVTLGDPAADPTRRTGIPVEPGDWNGLIDDPDVMLIDARNAFEVAFGTFAGAADPKLGRFGDFPRYAAAHLDSGRHTAVAMFCTGGIRCEKASAHLLGRGFATVYQLRGGILRYLETVPEAQSRWRGGCFVFDGRVTLGHGLAERPVRPDA